MSQKIKIISDSTSDLPPALCEQYGISVIPLTVTLGTDSYLDGVTIHPDQLYEYYTRHKALPKTAAPAPGAFQSEFKKWTEQGYDVICFTISSDFSASYTNACLAADGMRGVYVVDSRNLSTGVGLQILRAAEWAAQGVPTEELIRRLTALPAKVEASFIINTLEFLWKGGRCSGVAALGANVLRLKPCIDVVDGKMTVGKKFRGDLTSCVANYVRQRLENRTDIDTSRIFITHSGMTDPEDVETARRTIAQYQQFDEILETHANCTVCTHCGPNTLGVLFIRK